MRAGLYELVPVERLSLLSSDDLRHAILGELRVDVAEWQKIVKYEAPYSKVRAGPVVPVC